MSLSKKIISRIFYKAGLSIIESGIDKSKSAVIVAVHDPSFYKDVLIKGSLGLGNAYIEGKWDSASIDNVIFAILSSGIYQKLAPVYDLYRNTKSNIVNLQRKKSAKKVIEKHYDLPAEFFAAFLDPYLQYTCGFFEKTDNLNRPKSTKCS